MKPVLAVVALTALLGCPSPCGFAVTARDVQERVALDQHLGRTLPDTITLIDENGKPRHLTALLQGKPAVLALVYFECPNLCTLTLNSLAASVRKMKLTPGAEFSVLAVSIDPRETAALAARKRATYLAHDALARPNSPSWHFLTGQPRQIAALTSAVGFHYFWDASQGQFAHPAGVVILTPKRRISQYLNGMDFPPTELARALQRAAGDRTGSLAERLWLLCYHYDALFGRYSDQITVVLRILAVGVVLALATLIFQLTRTSQ